MLDSATCVSDAVYTRGDRRRNRSARQLRRPVACSVYCLHEATVAAATGCADDRRAISLEQLSRRGGGGTYKMRRAKMRKCENGQRIKCELKCEVLFAFLPPNAI